MLQKEKKALKYHSARRAGKIEIMPTKPLCTPEELALAYTPGAAVAAESISRNSWNVYKYTNKGNLVAIISNGSQLHNASALAAKPLLEGKSMLFKTYGDIDAYDIEIGEEEIEQLVKTICAMSPTFGGISLDEIQSPKCIEIEERLREQLAIPIFNDNREGISVCIAAAFINAVELTGKKRENTKIVICDDNTAGATVIQLLVELGADESQITTFDENDYKSCQQDFESSLRACDILISLTSKYTISKEILSTMASLPIIFTVTASTSPYTYNEILKMRPDAIVATRASSTPNQIETLLAFPYIFRGALDTLSTSINLNMLVAATYSIAGLAHQPTPQKLQKMYKRELAFGREYILPVANDQRLATQVSKAVAEAAIKSGTARRLIYDWENYCNTITSRLEREKRFCREIYSSYQTGVKLHRRYTKALPIMRV